MTLPPLNVGIVEAARLLGCGRSKVYELIDAGRLEAVKLGTRRLVRLASINRFSDTLAADTSLAKRAA